MRTKRILSLALSASILFGCFSVSSGVTATENTVTLPTPVLDSDNGELGYRTVNGVDLYKSAGVKPEDANLYSKKTGDKINAYSYRSLMLNTSYTDGEGTVQTPFKSDEISMSAWVKVDDMVEMARTDQGLEIFSLRWKNDIANNTISVTANQRGRIQLTGRGVDSEQVQLVKNSSTGIVSEKVRFPLFTTETEALYESNGDVIASAFDDTGDFAQFTVTRGFNADTNTYTLKLYINAEHTHTVDVEIPEGTKHDTAQETMLLFGSGNGGRLPLTATYAHTKVYTNELSQEQVTKLYEDTRDDFYEEGLRFELGVNNHTTPDLINKLGYQPITRYTANVGSRTMNRVVGTNPFTGEEYVYIDDLAHSASIPAKNIIEKDMTFETWLRPGAFSAGGTMPIFSVAGNGTSRPTLYLGITSQGTLMLETNQTEQLYNGVGTISPSPGTIASNEAAGATVEDRTWVHIAITRSWDENTRSYTYLTYVDGELKGTITEEFAEDAQPLDESGLYAVLNGKYAVNSINSGGSEGSVYWRIDNSYMDTKIYAKALTATQIKDEYESKTALLDDSNDIPREDGLQFELGINNNTTPELINKLDQQPIVRYTSGAGSRVLSGTVGKNPYTGEEYEYINDLAHSAAIPAKNIIEKDMTFETWLRPAAFNAGGTMPIFSIAGDGTIRPTLYLGITSQGTLMMEINQTEQIYNGVGTISPSPGTIASNEAAGATVEDRTWVHIAITRNWDDNTRSYTYLTYVDGELKGTITEEFAEDAQPLDESDLYAVLNGKYAINSINSGGNETTVYWRVDNSYMDTKIYTKALTAAEIKDEYESKTALHIDNADLKYEGISLLNENKELIDDLNNVEKVYASVYVENNSTEAATANVILAGYDKADKLITSVIDEISVPEAIATKTTLYTDEYIDLSANSDIYKVKAFLWDSVSGMKPLTEFIGRTAPDATLATVYNKVRNNEEVDAIIIGGSITQGASANSGGGYAYQLENYLKENWNIGKWDHLSSGGTRSGYGTFALDKILDTPYDIAFIEYAANDGFWEKEDRIFGERTTEGLIRQIYDANPDADVILINTLSYDMAKVYDKGLTPAPIESKNKVADHLGLGRINVAKALYDDYVSTGNPWNYYMDGIVHPRQTGHDIYFNTIKSYIEDTFEEYDAGGVPEKYVVPETALNGYYITGRRIPLAYSQTDETGNKIAITPENVTIGSGWTKPTNGTYTGLHGSYVYICSDASSTDGSNTVTVKFEGDAVGVHSVSVHNIADMCYQLDNGEVKVCKASDFTGASWRYAILEENLSEGEHELKIWPAGTADGVAVSGDAAQIAAVNFFVYDYVTK